MGASILLGGVIVFMKLRSILTVALYCLVAFINGFFINLRGPMLPTVASRINTTLDGMGPYFVSASVGGTVMALPSGFFVDFTSGHFVLVFGLLLRAVSVFGVPFVTTLFVWCCLALFQGFSSPLIVTPT